MLGTCKDFLPRIQVRKVFGISIAAAVAAVTVAVVTVVVAVTVAAVESVVAVVSVVVAAAAVEFVVAAVEFVAAAIVVSFGAYCYSMPSSFKSLFIIVLYYIIIEDKNLPLMLETWH